jgi:hypothetical protein
VNGVQFNRTLLARFGLCTRRAITMQPTTPTVRHGPTLTGKADSIFSTAPAFLRCFLKDELHKVIKEGSHPMTRGDLETLGGIGRGITPKEQTSESKLKVDKMRNDLRRERLQIEEALLQWESMAKSRSPQKV